MAYVTRLCENCGRPFQADTRNIARSWGKCCSKSCAAILREKTAGEEHPRQGHEQPRRLTFDEMVARANAEPTKRKPRHIESHIQRNCLTWFRLQYPELRLVLFAVPNGGARNKREAGILKAEGVTAGVADMILLTPSGNYGALCIEFKTDEGTQRQSQKEWQQAAETAGNKYVIVRSIEDFMHEINTYLRPA